MSPAVAMESPFRLNSQTAYRLAEKYGTPLYVLSEDVFRYTIRRYRTAFAQACKIDNRQSKIENEVSYASKANGTLALLKIAHEEGCTIDVASEGELRGALLAGVPASACDFHGNNKSQEEIQFALAAGVRTIIAGNQEELQLLNICGLAKTRTKLLLRLAPGVDPITHERIATDQEDSKFGFNLAER